MLIAYFEFDKAMKNSKSIQNFSELSKCISFYRLHFAYFIGKLSLTLADFHLNFCNCLDAPEVNDQDVKLRAKTFISLVYHCRRTLRWTVMAHTKILLIYSMTFSIFHGGPSIPRAPEKIIPTSIILDTNLINFMKLSCNAIYLTCPKFSLRLQFLNEL